MNNDGFPILNISDIPLYEEIDKLHEETDEFIYALNKLNKSEEDLKATIENIIEEFYDIVQVMVNILYEQDLIHLMEDGLNKHIEKMKARDWDIVEYI